MVFSLDRRLPDYPIHSPVRGNLARPETEPLVGLPHRYPITIPDREEHASGFIHEVQVGTILWPLAADG